MKKTITLLLVLALSLGLLTACGSTEIRSYQDDAESEDIFANALTAYAPDTLVATADGTPVYWNEFAYWLAYIGSQMAQPDEEGKIDWYAAEGSEEPLADALLANVRDSLLSYHILEGMAAERGIEFGEDGEEYVEGMIQDAIASVAGEEGTEEDFADYLKDYYLDMDVLRYQGKIQYLYTKLFEELFGANGEKVTDEDIAEYVEENGLMLAKHILYSFSDETGAEIDDAAKAEKKAAAEKAVQELRAVTDNEALVQKFDEIMNAESEDPGLAYYPDGYVFGPGEMMEEFENGAAALKDFEVSDPVETSAGYHVILRLPLTGEANVGADSSGNDVSLRYQVAMEQFNDLATARTEAAEIVWEKGFENPDLNKIFAGKDSGGFFAKIFGKH